MHYLLMYNVVTDYLEKRTPHREAHLALARAAADRGELLLAGAVENGKGGVLFVFQGDSPAAAEAFAKEDPYVKHGVVTEWAVREWNTVVGTALETK